MSDAAKKNLDAAHGVQKMFETKDFSKIGDYIAENATDHSGPTGPVTGLANLKASFVTMAAQSENDKSEVIKELADDEYVMSWMRYTGTCKVGGMGMKPGDKIDMRTVEISKFKDGKATDHWTMMDAGDMMKMMPPMPGPDHKMPADSSKGKMKADTAKHM